MGKQTLLNSCAMRLPRCDGLQALPMPQTDLELALAALGGRSFPVFWPAAVR